MLEQRLPMCHQHWHQAYRIGVTNDLDELLGAIRLPICIRHIPAGNLQASTGPLETPIGIDLLLHLREGGNGHTVRVFRQITMGAMKRAIARPEDETAMGQVSARNLIWRLQFTWQRLPAFT